MQYAGLVKRGVNMHKNEGPSEMRWGLIGKSGRPDLNRGPPAPKAGAIPGYATPRSARKLLYPAFRAQRAEKRAKRSCSVAQRCRIFDR
jgi:hypothetical protein